MASVPSIPPLLCSTPPPIEFGEHDDDSGLSPTLTLEDEEDVFGEYNTNNEGLTPDVPSLPRTPLQNELSSSTTTSGFTETLTVHDDTATTAEDEITVAAADVVEAFNYEITDENMCKVPIRNDVKQNDQTDISNETHDNQSSQAELVAKIDAPTVCINFIQNSSCALINDNAALSETNLEQNTDNNEHVAYYNDKSIEIILEDLPDDSSDDEQHSPKRVMVFDAAVDASCSDFYAIHSIESSSTSNLSASIENNSVEVDDFAEFTEFERTGEKQLVQNVSAITSNNISDSDVVFEADFSTFANNENSTNIPEANNNIVKTATVGDEDFDDFQDFSCAVHSVTSEKEELVKVLVKETAAKDLNEIAEDVDDDDDEFGDFTEATVTNVDNIQTQQPATVNLTNLHERLKTVLSMMFPLDDDSEEQTETTTNTETLAANKRLQLQSIDAAKALDYQWSGSEMRNALIKSIGIDSRNILYGENWNSSMPRFAANLSCNPLQPLKPQNASSVSHNNTTSADECVTGKKANDVPAVDFDWNSSGLVNPLDGPKEILQSRETETLQSTSSIEYAVTNNDEQQQQISTDNNHIESSKHDIGGNNNNNSTTTSSATIGTSAATTLSPAISADSISNTSSKNHNNSNNNSSSSNNNNKLQENYEQTIDLGFHVDRVINYNTQTTNDNKRHDINNWLTQDQLEQQDEDEVVTTSTYAGPLKETHIYTPPRGGEHVPTRTVRAGYVSTPNTPMNNMSSHVARVEPIDFDYEKAAAGIIIDETVVKKEYRDVEYNPGFGLDYDAVAKNVHLNETDILGTDDDFTEFQSVPPPPIAQPMTKTIITNSPAYKAKQLTNTSRTSTPTFVDEMILSPAILLPQSVTLDSNCNNNNNSNNYNNNNNNNKPKIEWGETASCINPEELARIEELFPQPKLQKTKDALNNSQKVTPTHVSGSASVMSSPLTISAKIAHKEQVGAEEDDWCEFVSVPVAVNKKTPTRMYTNQQQSQIQHQQQQHHWLKQQNNLNANNDDEWSDFVSSSPAPAQTQMTTGMQFNSGAWQNANFYNNPLSFYHHQQQQQHQQNFNNNNNNNINYYNNNANNQLQQHHNKPTYTSNITTQQIHIMQDFSTAPPNMQQYQRHQLQQQQQNQQQQQRQQTNANQFQIGSAKIAPSISLIPDLGFVAPAMPAHTTFVNALPKSTFSMKK